MATKITLRKDTATNWSTVNPVLENGEFGLDTTNRIVKLGDGVTAWNSLEKVYEQAWDVVNINEDLTVSGVDTDFSVTLDYTVFGTAFTSYDARLYYKLSTDGVYTEHTTVKNVISGTTSYTWTDLDLMFDPSDPKIYNLYVEVTTAWGAVVGTTNVYTYDMSDFSGVDTLTFTGDGTTGRTLTAPNIDFVNVVWSIPNSNSYHKLFSSQLQAEKISASTLTSETASLYGATVSSYYGALPTDSNYTIGTSTTANMNTVPYYNLIFKLGGQSSFSTTNSDGVNVRSRVNDTYGISLVTYTGNHTTDSPEFAHNLAAKPQFLFQVNGYNNTSYGYPLVAFDNSATQDGSSWTGARAYAALNFTSAYAVATTVDSTYMYIGNASTYYYSNYSGINYTTLAITSKPGFSKVGRYSGTGNATAIDVDCGFKPRLVFLAPANQTFKLFSQDYSTNDVATSYLYPTIMNVNVSTTDEFTFTDTGFTVTTSNSALNPSGTDNIYYVALR